MGYKFVGGVDGDQVFLMPPDPREWLPAGHLAWAVREAAREVDITPFLAAYRADGQGRPAYHPRMMAALVIYCYAKGVRSSRAVEMATFDDVGARVICGGLHPDHATVAHFVRRHEQPVRGLLVQSLVACAEEGLVRVEVVAGDGTKVKANASMAANAAAEQLEMGIAELEKLIAAEVDAWITEARAADEAEDALCGDGGEAGPPAGTAGPGTGRKRTAQVLARRQAARAKLAAEEQARRDRAEAERAEKTAKLAAENSGWKPAPPKSRRRRRPRRRTGSAAPRPRPPPDPAGSRTGAARCRQAAHRDVRNARAAAARAGKALEDAQAAPAPEPERPAKVNCTDPSSRVMPAKKGGFGQLFNAQALAARGQVVLAIGRHDSPVDVQALHPLLDQAAANLHAARIPDRIGTALFDTGYASDANFTAPCAADLHVAVTREARQTGKSAARRAPAAKQSWQDMSAKLDTPEGKALYAQRGGIIEPLRAQLFARFGRALHYRGDMADTELHLWAADCNILKATRARARREQREHRIALTAA